MVSHKPFPDFKVLITIETGINGIITFQNRNILFQIKYIFPENENPDDAYLLANP